MAGDEATLRIVLEDSSGSPAQLSLQDLAELHKRYGINLDPSQASPLPPPASSSTPEVQTGGGGSSSLPPTPPNQPNQSNQSEPGPTPGPLPPPQSSSNPQPNPSQPQSSSSPQSAKGPPVSPELQAHRDRPAASPFVTPPPLKPPGGTPPPATLGEILPRSLASRLPDAVTGAQLTGTFGKLALSLAPAIPALVLFTSVAGAAAVAFRLASSAARQAADSLAEIDPRVAAAKSLGEIERLKGLFDRSQRIGPQLANYDLAQSQLQRAIEELKTTILKDLIPSLTKAADYAAVTVETVNEWWPYIRNFLKVAADVAPQLKGLETIAWILDKFLGEKVKERELQREKDIAKFSAELRDFLTPGKIADPIPEGRGFKRFVPNQNF